MLLPFRRRDGEMQREKLTRLWISINQYDRVLQLKDWLDRISNDSSQIEHFLIEKHFYLLFESFFPVYDQRIHIGDTNYTI